MYTRPPAWSFASEGTAELWRSIQDGANAAAVFPELNRMVNLLNECLVYVRPCGDHLTYRLVLPQDVTVWPDPDNPATPFAAMFRESMVNVPKGSPVYHYWSRYEDKPEYRCFDAGGREIRKEVNPYKDEAGMPAIPLTAYHRSLPTWSFWDQTTGGDVYELTIMVGMWETWVNHLIRTDSTRQKWASGQLMMTDQQGGPTAIMSLRSTDATPVSVGEFSSQSDWAGLGGQIKRKLQNVLDNNGMSLADDRTSGDPTSGFALTVRSKGLTDLRERQVPLYRTWDRGLYATVAAVWNFELTNPKSPAITGNPLPWPSEAKPDIKYAQFQTSQTVEERNLAYDLAVKQMSKGLTSPLVLYMEEHPGCTEGEARAAIQKNLADTQAIAPEPVAPPVAPPGDTPGATPEPEDTAMADAHGEEEHPPE